MQLTSGGTPMTPSPFVIETTGLTKRFGGRTVVQDVELQVPRANCRVGACARGMRQRLGIARLLPADPELLILDEPMNGLDPAGIEEFRFLIRSLVAEGRTVMLSSHLLDEVEKTVDALAIVDQGRVIAQGSIADLTRSGPPTLVIASGDNTRAGHVLGAHRA